MGCDIHISIECQNSDGAWELVDAVMPSQFDDRNYSLFGILADVRNGTGFAGIVTSDRWPSIAPLRGWPADANLTPAQLWEPFDENDVRYNALYGDHSYTWVSLDELQSFDWAGTRRIKRGVLSWDEWIKWRESSRVEPSKYCGWTSARTINEAQAIQYEQHDKPNVECVWMMTALDATRNWPTVVIPELERVANRRPLRLLLSFDS